MTEFLAATKYCDCSHPAVMATAGALSRRRSARDAAVRLFRFVRDGVQYAFGPWGIPASSTLSRRQGTCSNKSNLVVALFRATGIPAAYGVMRVDGQEYFGNINPPFFKHLMSRYSVHVYAAAYLDGRWVKCDPSTDQALAAKTSNFCQQTRLVEWDGVHDALDFLDPAHVYADLGLRPSLDDLLDKPARNATAATCGILNAYLRFVRRNPPFRSAQALIDAYLQHLGRETEKTDPSHVTRSLVWTQEDGRTSLIESTPPIPSLQGVFPGSEHGGSTTSSHADAFEHPSPSLFGSGRADPVLAAET